MNGQGPRPSSIIDLEEEAGSQNTINAHKPGERQVSAFVSIMQGCNMKCTFCIVPKTRGPERARPIDDIVAEVEELVANGTREVTLLGQIVSSYGRREIPFADKKSPFVQLLERLNAVEGLERIRFTSPHPRGFKDDLVQAYGELSKLCEYVHLPVQSGSDSILKAMNRPYTSGRYMELINDLRAVQPDIHISTDIIVGFPGESEEDFQLTCDLFKEAAFDMAFIFKYSPRSGTPASELEDNVPQSVKDDRNQVLLRLLEQQSLRRNNSLVGTVQEILVEGPARKGEGMYMGRTRGFRKVIFPSSERLVGELVPVRIDESSVTTLKGQLEIVGVA